MKNIWITAIASILMVGFAVMFGLLGKPTEMSLIIVAGAIAISFLNIDRIQRFKGAGFEAEMKQAVEHVHATVDQLRILAAASAESTLTSLMAGNFSSGTSLRTRLDLHDCLINSLEEIGVPSPTIAKADHWWRKGIGLVYHRAIHHFLDGWAQKALVNVEANPSVSNAAKEFQGLLNFDAWQAPSPQEMRDFLNAYGAMNTEVNDLLEDYAYFERTNQIRRRDVFVTL